MSTDYESLIYYIATTNIIATAIVALLDKKVGTAIPN
jgi:hypothetical protein